MIRIHCDMEECERSAEVGPGFQGGVGVDVPVGWMALTWEKVSKGEPTASEQAAGDMIKQFGAMMPKGSSMPDLLGVLPPPVDRVRFEAFLCPTHAGDLPLREFHQVSKRRLGPDES